MASKTTKAPKSKSAPVKTKTPAKPGKVSAKAATAKTKATKSAPSKAKAAAKPAAKAKTAAKPAKAKEAPKAAAKAAKPAAKAAKAKAAPAKPAPKKKPAKKVELKAPPPKAAGTKPTNAASRLMAAAKNRAEKARKAETAAAKEAAVKQAADAAAKAKAETAKPAAPRANFKAKEFVVYPAHGVGQILDIEEQEVAGHRLELFVINFDKEKMTLRVPTNKAGAVGMRKLSDAGVVDSAIETLRGRARIKRTMWSRRAQEYEAKINSGDLISIAEVVRDLYRSERQPEQSYSERQLYEAALDRMAREVAVVERIGEDAAVQRVEQALQGASRSEKAPKSDEASEAA